MSDRSDITNGLVAAAIARGDALARKGKYRRAIRVWRRLLESEGDEVELAQGLIRSKIAATYYRLSRLALRGRVTRKSWLRATERLRLALRYESHPDYYIELGRCYLKLGQLEKADEALSRVLHIGTSSEKALYYAAVTKIRMGDIAGARELIERGSASEISTEVGWWSRLRALCTALEGDTPGALTIANPPYVGVPPDVWFEDIACFARASAPSVEVVRTLDVILDALDDREAKNWLSEIGVMIGDIYAHLGEYEEAVRYWTDAADGDFSDSHMDRVALTCEYQIIQAVNSRALDAAGKWYRIGIENGVEETIKPLESVIHFYLAKEAWGRGDYRAAASGFNACLRWRASIDAARNLAVSYEAYGDWLNAATAWQTAYDLASPDRSAVRLEASRRQGLALIRAGSFDQAKVALQRSLEIDSDDEISLYLGCVLILLGEFDASAAYMRKAVGDNGENTCLLVGLAIAVELADRNLDDKVMMWQRATRVSEESWVHRFWRRRLLDMGDGRLCEGRLDEALECYISLLVEDLDDQECWIRCGAVHLRRGHVDKARRCFSEALKSGESGEVDLLIGEHLMRVGEEDEALNHLRRAWRLDPTPTTDLRIARIYVECGKPTLALTHLRRALDRCSHGDHQVPRIVELALRIGDAEAAGSLLLDAIKLSDDLAFPRLLLAAQSMKTGRWAEAKETLKDVEEGVAAANDVAISADLTFFQRALERLRASRPIDTGEFGGREQELTRRWVERRSRGESETNERAQLIAWARRQLQITGSLDPVDVERIQNGEMPLPLGSLPRLIELDQPLQVHRLLAHEPKWE